MQIGGTDLTCIKHPVTLKPYIPGSSIKGKMRSELEQKLGKFGGRDKANRAAAPEPTAWSAASLGRTRSAQHELGPTRIVVRDAPCTQGGETELKSENVIDRKTGTALHPRKVERVVAGSEFSLRIGIQVWDLDAKSTHNGKTGGDALVEFVKDGLRALQQTGLGSGISKGSGEIEFRDLKLDGTPFTL